MVLKGESKSVERCAPPVFFVSVASKGFSFGLSLLFATLAGICVSVASEIVRERGGRGRKKEKIGLKDVTRQFA